VQSEEGGSHRRDRADSSGDGVGDVVELEIEKYVEAAVAKALDYGVSSGVVKLHANLEPTAGALKLVDEVHGEVDTGEVEGDDEAIYWIAPRLIGRAGVVSGTGSGGRNVGCGGHRRQV
jgi:hypothetical protein